MKSFRRIPVFEQLEQKRLLAADTCEHEPVDQPLAVESAPLVVEHVEPVSNSLGASVPLQNNATANGNQTEHDDEEDSNEERETESETVGDTEDDTDEQDDSDENDEESSEDNEMTDEESEMDETDDMDDATDVDEMDDMDMDDMDETDETDDATDMDEMDDMDDATDMDEMDDMDDATDMDETTNTTTAPAAILSAAASQDAAVEQPFLVAVEADSSDQARTAAATAGSGAAPAAGSDALADDLLLAIADSNEMDQPVSNEFVGRSDQRDAAPAVLELLMDEIDEEAISPSLPGDPL